MSDEKKRIGNVQTIGGKFGSFKKLSLDLESIGSVIEKDGKVYVEISSSEGYNKWEKEGKTKHFLNLVLNDYTTVSLDSFKPSSGGGGSKSSDSGSDDLPF